MGLRKNISSLLSKYLLSRGVFTTQRTNLQDLKDFFKITYPSKLEVENIRIGGENDGGYIIPNDFAGIKYCFSPGVGNLFNFERDLTKKSIKCFLADYSVDFKTDNELIDFDKKFIGPVTKDKFISLKDWICSKIDYENNNDLILQLDVEGDEYDIINSIDENTLKKFRIILVEFHQLHYLFDSFLFKKIKSAFSILNKFFYCTHIHPNNNPEIIVKQGNIVIPPVLEFSFLRRDRSRITEGKLHFPSDLDQPNNKNKLDLKLPKCWFRQ